ncbi:hypothetical protein H5410_013503 [Solanum commersonii]|uniref:Uncharacterized protein n=1 Tax=Solanum commersonii TaxID=4109 RepID=A0A9J5ZNL3_SOLCO|nr:hypothetical protein H5410_013503 [Solanum commersonii]
MNIEDRKDDMNILEQRYGGDSSLVVAESQEKEENLIMEDKEEADYDEQATQVLREIWIISVMVSKSKKDQQLTLQLTREDGKQFLTTVIYGKCNVDEIF